jgi:NAD(P)H-hydrate epimerase
MIRLTRAQVREIDRRAIEEYHVPGILLMENAADAAFIAARTLIPNRIDTAGPVIVVCGGGNNGGDGLGVARKLHDWASRASCTTGASQRESSSPSTLPPSAAMR